MAEIFFGLVETPSSFIKWHKYSISWLPKEHLDILEKKYSALGPQRQPSNAASGLHKWGYKLKYHQKRPG